MIAPRRESCRKVNMNIIFTLFCAFNAVKHAPSLCVPKWWNCSLQLYCSFARKKTQCWTEKEVKLQYRSNTDLANPTRRSRHKMVLQSYTVLDQENWNFIPLVNKLLSADCVERHVTLGKTTLCHEDGSYSWPLFSVLS